MKVLVLALLFATALAGCMLGPAADTEEAVMIRIEADGPYRVGIPLPLHDESDLADWVDGVQAAPTAETRTWQTPEGELFVIEGDGPLTLFLTLDHRGDTEAYLDAAWSAGGNDTHVQAGIWAGQVTLRVAYTADSPYCGRTDRYVGTGEAETQRADDQPPQWFELVGEREAVCQ